jgi:hypothetical protein
LAGNGNFQSSGSLTYISIDSCCLARLETKFAGYGDRYLLYFSVIYIGRILIGKLILVVWQGGKEYICSTLEEVQGDQIGRIFAYWVVVYVGQCF